MYWNFIYMFILQKIPQTFFLRDLIKRLDIFILFWYNTLNFKKFLEKFKVRAFDVNISKIASVSMVL